MRIRPVAMLMMLGLVSGIARAQPIDFETDIKPILTQHCIKCHGEDRAEAGLSLHSHEAALKGGDSGKPILGGTLDTNEILRRVKSSDLDVRMPYEDDPLDAESIGKLERWVEQGSPWPAADEAKPTSTLDKVTSLIERWVSPYLFWLIGLVVAVVVIERIKAVGRKREDGGSALFQRSYALARRVTPAVYIIVLLAVVLGVVIDQVLRLERKLDYERNNRVVAEKSQSIHSVFGDPPVPMRPSHLPRLGGLYYRGNNERKAGLYNNGHYRTATLELSLVDRSGKKLAYGGAADEGLQIHLLIRRAPGATPLLFSDDIMDGLLLATGYHPKGLTVFDRQAGVFKPTDEPDAWQAFFPLKNIETDGSGLVYLYRGTRDASGNIQTRGTPQLGIVYDLKLKDGRIDPASELWLDAIYYPENVVPPPAAGLVPWDEWFSTQPIPQIKGRNTEDPDLLGVDGDGDGGE